MERQESVADARWRWQLLLALQRTALATYDWAPKRECGGLPFEGHILYLYTAFSATIQAPIISD